MAFRIDGLLDFMLLHDVHTAFTLNQTEANIGTNGAASAGAITLYGQAATDEYPGYGSVVKSLPTPSGDFDSFTTVDAGMLVYLPPTPTLSDQSYGLWHNGGGTNAQAGFCRYNSTVGWQLNVHLNAGANNADDVFYTLGFVSGWFALGFQFADNAGNMGLWVNGVKIIQQARIFEALYGSGNPSLGDSASTDPTAWGAQQPINGSGIIISNFFAGNITRTNPSANVAGYGDVIYTNYYQSMLAIATEVLKVWDGTAWLPCALKMWDGTGWKPVKYWNGTEWLPKDLIPLTIPLKSIIAEYKFEDNTIDSVGFNDGTPTDLTYEAGLVGQTGVFNGTSSIVKMNGSASNLDFNAVDFSVSQLIKVPTYTTSMRFSQNRGSGTIGLFAGWQVNMSNATIWNNIVVDDGLGNSVNMSSVPMNEDDNAWHHLTITWDTSTGTLRLYIDGSLGGQSTNPNLIDANLNGLDVCVGGANQNTQYLIGNVDCVRIWDKKLTSSEIALIAGDELAGKDINPLSTIPLSNIIAEYKFENNTLDTVGVHDGTETSINYGPGLVDQCINFGISTSSELNIPNAADLTFTNGSNDLPFSVTFAINPVSLANNPRVIDKSSLLAQNTNREIRVIIFEDKPILQLSDNSSGGNINTRPITDTLPLNTWTHITYTYDGSGSESGLKTYFNGVDVSLNALNGTYSGMENLGEPITIGKDAAITTSSLDGKMDCIRFWDRVLEADEVLAISTLEKDGVDINSRPFIITINTATAGESNTDQFTLPATGSYVVDWGDGIIETGSGKKIHTYDSAGVYDISVSGNLERILFHNEGDRTKLLDVKQWGNTQWTSFGNAFKGCLSLTTISATDAPDLASVGGLSSMFDSSSLSGVFNMNDWDFSRGDSKSMASMFSNCRFGASNIQIIKNSGIGWENVRDMTAFGYFADVDYSGVDWALANTINITSFYQAFRLSGVSFSGVNFGAIKTDSCTSIRLMFADHTIPGDYQFSPEDWDVTSVIDFREFLNGEKISTASYDATLIKWSAQVVSTGEAVDFGGSKYTLGGAAEAARNVLTNTYGWIITDGGGI